MTMFLLLGLACLFVAHEASHAAAAQAFGLRWKVFAHLPFTAGIGVFDPSPRQSMAIALAGPGMNVAIFLALRNLAPPWSFIGVMSLLMATLPSAVDYLVVYRSLRLMRRTRCVS